MWKETCTCTEKEDDRETMQKFYQEKEVAKRKEEQEQAGYERRVLGDYVYSQYWYG